MTGRSPEAVRVMFQHFACFLRQTRRNKSTTIDQYISHCVTTLTEQHWVGAPHIRSPMLNKLLAGWTRQDIKANPKRLTSSIPATAAVMSVFFQVASYQYRDNPQRSAEIQACAAATYYMALRPAEGAASTTQARDGPPEYSPDAHHLLAAKVCFRFKNDPQFYLAHAGTVFPPGKVPESMDILQDSTKNTTQRGSAHRGAHRNPNPDGKPFDVVLLVWNYVTRFPPHPDGPFFPNITAQDITVTMKLTANHSSVRLDPNRLTARCLRSGSVTMLRNMKNNLINQQDLARIRDHGQWAGDVGSHIYAHASPDAERLLVAPSLYDDGFMTLHYLRWFYMSPP